MSQGLSELKAMETAYAALQPLEPVAQRRAVEWLLGALSMQRADLANDQTPIETSPQDRPGFGESSAAEQNELNGPFTPKEFINQKKPQTIAERIACLAFYLAHYRNTSSFGSAEIESLNTEAAQSSINRSRDVDNARRLGYLVPAADGKKQISAKGEEFVNALPDRGAVKSVRSNHQTPRRRKSSNGAKKSDAPKGDAQ
jgi:hypothetical protein